MNTEKFLLFCICSLITSRFSFTATIVNSPGHMHSENTGLLQEMVKNRLKFAFRFSKILLFQNWMSQQNRLWDYSISLTANYKDGFLYDCASALKKSWTINFPTLILAYNSRITWEVLTILWETTNELKRRCLECRFPGRNNLFFFFFSTLLFTLELFPI